MNPWRMLHIKKCIQQIVCNILHATCSMQYVAGIRIDLKTKISELRFFKLAQRSQNFGFLAFKGQAGRRDGKFVLQQ
jgi:hypothetical protein